jgi:prepilin-type N-terminal cleavage/methylation domain-containing protein
MEMQAAQWKIKHEQGMTMVEMVIVLAMTAVFSLFMGTGLQSMADRIYLDTAVAELIGDLRYARSMAVREEETVQVAVDSGQPGVTLFRASAPGQPVAPTRNLMNRGIRVIRSTGGSLLSFYPRGTSATPTTLTLEDRRGGQRVVTVSLTGIVRAR